jgi:hypothetical protein
VALGGQSIWALRIRQTTTYFTGMLTRTISAAATGSPTGASIGTAARQLAALLTGALLGGAMLHWLRPAAPAAPLTLLAMAAIAHVSTSRKDTDGRPGSPPGNDHER